MRTNIVLNAELMREAMKYARAQSKTGLVEEALRTFVEVKAREARLQTYAQRFHRLEAKLGAVQLRQPPRDVLREDRDSG